MNVMSSGTSCIVGTCVIVWETRPLHPTKTLCNQSRTSGGIGIGGGIGFLQPHWLLLRYLRSAELTPCATATGPNQCPRLTSRVTSWPDMRMRARLRQRPGGVLQGIRVLP
jgi:hypothetical protein